MSRHDYLKAFAASQCGPVMVLPGITGSRLKIKIDCEALREDDPKTFGICGWSKCGSGDKHSPKATYDIWFPRPLSPMTILSPNLSNKACFKNLISPIYTKTEEKGYHYIHKKGVDLVVQGNTDDSRHDGTCAFSGIMDLYPDFKWLGLLPYYKSVHEKFKHMGYIDGLTMQGMPYDFRISYQENLLGLRFPRIVEGLFNTTGKKVTIYAHSMGNLNTVYELQVMDQADKDKWINGYMALAPPFSGAGLPVKELICGDDGLHLLDLGLDFETAKVVIGNFVAVFELLPSDTF